MADYRKQIEKCILEIKDLDSTAMADAKAYQDTLAMPPGSLGTLLDIGIKLAGITGFVKNTINSKRIIVLCSDNGVVEEGVSSAPKSVTAMQAVNMTKHLTGMSCLAEYFDAQVQVVDVGIETEYDCNLILNRKVRKGTDNIAKGPAMTLNEAEKAVSIGIELARQAKKDGVDIIGVGEMGIGNTTTSSAVLSALTGTKPALVTGRGGGLTDDAFRNKIKVIEKALSANKIDSNNAIDVLSKVGGLDLASMCGVFLGAASVRLPVVIDGYISIVAALCAYKICKNSAGYFFGSHQSEEIGYLVAAKEIGINPFLQLNMRLGEGSGCPLAFQIIDASCAIMNKMATFGQASIDDGYLSDIRAEQKNKKGM